MVYPYKCGKCGEIEVNTSPQNIPLKECPYCECEDIERIFERVNVALNFNGSYNSARGGN